MLIRDLRNNFFFTTGAFALAVFENQIKIISNNPRESVAPVWIDDLGVKEAMDHIYKCYKRGDRCCDLNDLKKDKTK